MTEVATTNLQTLEFPTANGAYRAGRIAFIHALWHADIVRESYVRPHAAAAVTMVSWNRSVDSSSSPAPSCSTRTFAVA